MKAMSVVLAAGILLAASINLQAQPETAGPKAPRYIEGELLVKFKGGPKGEAAGRLKHALKHKVKRDFDAIGWQHIQLPPGLTVEEALARYKDDPDVLAVEPNHILPPMEPPPMPEPTLDFGGQESSGAGGVTPNDPQFTNQWNLVKIGAPEAWAVTTGSTNVVVAVIDTGINYDHEDLQANMWRNPGEIPGNGIDDDGNEYVDDVYGIDAIDHDSDPRDGQASTGSVYHGTACAGIIGAVGNNGVGLAGVNWSVQLMAVRVTGTNLTSAGFTEGYNYVLTMKQRGVNLRAINASHSTRIYTNQAWADALAALGDAGVLAVCAAGNRGSDEDVEPYYPASYNLPNIISVAASDQSDNLAWWSGSSSSSWGRTNVDLAAPGSAISFTSGPGTDSYASGNGTSFAAPHVAGAVALLAAAYPEATATDIKQALLETVDVLPAFTNKMVSNGRLNVDRALSRLGEFMNTAPLIDSQPLSQTVLAGAFATFVVEAHGARPMGCQWYVGDVPLPGATNLTLTFTNAQLSHSGRYRAMLFNPLGTTNTDTVELSVVPLLITTQPHSRLVAAGRNGTLSVAVTSTVPFACQWQWNGTDLPQATNLTLAFTNAQPEQAGAYRAVLSNSYGVVTSEVATLTVMILPLIVEQPCAQSVVRGGSVTLSVVVTNTAGLPIGYRWRRGALTVTNLLLDEFQSFFTVTNVQDCANYDVVTTNLASPGTPMIRSRTVAVCALPDDDGDGLADAWELHYFGTTNVPPQGDPDGDGLTTLAEHDADTDPTNALSCLRLELLGPPAGRGPVGMRFCAATNKTYTVQARPSVDTGPWHRVADVAAAATNRVVELVDPLPASADAQRFYRLVTPRVP